MRTNSEDLDVRNIVDFIARILEHLDLHFFDFSTVFYIFLKVTDYSS